MSKQLIEVDGLKKYFNVGKGKVLKAVDNISFSIREGETLGMVGESGCGKTTAGRTVLRLYEPTAGSVKFNGTDIYNLSPGKMKAMRRDMQMIFQDPYASLNPRFTVQDIIGEALDIHNMAGSRAERKNGSKSCSTWSALIMTMRPGIRMNSPAASASGSGLPAPCGQSEIHRLRRADLGA